MKYYAIWYFEYKIIKIEKYDQSRFELKYVYVDLIHKSIYCDENVYHCDLQEAIRGYVYTRRFCNNCFILEVDADDFSFRALPENEYNKYIALL